MTTFGNFNVLIVGGGTMGGDSASSFAAAGARTLRHLIRQRHHSPRDRHRPRMFDQGSEFRGNRVLSA